MLTSSYAALRCQSIEKMLHGLIPEKQDTPHSLLFESARYSLLSAAKRLRPLLTLATAESFGAHMDICLYPACAIEMVHTYSLIHDDLPCMDDDDLRRGKPSLHKVVGEGQAVLTGDYLLTYAFEVLCKSPGISDTQKVDLIKTLAQRAGGDGMVGGQAVDLLSEGKPADWPTLQFIHHHKTAALLCASIEFGAILANVSEQDRRHLEVIGYEAGLAFQIIDDILDVIGSEKDLGKPIRSDLDHQKCTAVSVLGLPGAQSIANKLRESIRTRCKMLSVDAYLLNQILEQLIHRTS
ncbi:MAG: polyprenyl synthetase family protein [Chlamydiia bacterium]